VLTSDIKPQLSIKVIKSATIPDRLNYCHVLSAWCKYRPAN